MGDPRERNYQSLFSELAGYEKKGVYMLMNGVPAKSHADCAGSHCEGGCSLYAGLCVE